MHIYIRGVALAPQLKLGGAKMQVLRKGNIFEVKGDFRKVRELQRKLNEKYRFCISYEDECKILGIDPEKYKNYCRMWNGYSAFSNVDEVFRNFLREKLEKCQTSEEAIKELTEIRDKIIKAYEELLGKQIEWEIAIE